MFKNILTIGGAYWVEHSAAAAGKSGKRPSAAFGEGGGARCILAFMPDEERDGGGLVAWELFAYGALIFGRLVLVTSGCDWPKAARCCAGSRTRRALAEIEKTLARLEQTIPVSHCGVFLEAGPGTTRGDPGRGRVRRS